MCACWVPGPWSPKPEPKPQPKEVQVPQPAAKRTPKEPKANG
jgi:hypothetical protein